MDVSFSTDKYLTVLYKPFCFGHSLSASQNYHNLCETVQQNTTGDYADLDEYSNTYDAVFLMLMMLLIRILMMILMFLIMQIPMVFTILTNLMF